MRKISTVSAPVDNSVLGTCMTRPAEVVSVQRLEPVIQRRLSNVELVGCESNLSRVLRGHYAFRMPLST